MNKLFNIPKKGQRELFISNGDVSKIDVLKRLVSDKTKTVRIITWQLGVQNIRYLQGLSKNIETKILLDVSYMNRNRGYYDYLKKMIGHIVWLTSTHAKILLLADDKNSYVVLSSANFNRNFRLEFFDITNDDKVYGYLDAQLQPFFEGLPIEKHNKARSQIVAEYSQHFVKEQDYQFDISDALNDYRKSVLND